MNATRDVELVGRAVRGDREAFAELCREYYEPLRRFVVARLVYPHLVDDVLQESFLRVYEALPKHDVGTPFWAFLQEFAKRVVLEELRAAKRTSDPVLQRLARRRRERLESGAGAELDSRLGALETCLAKLPEQARRIVGAVYEEGAGLADLAPRLKMGASALAARLYRIRNALRECIAHETKGA